MGDTRTTIFAPQAFACGLLCGALAAVLSFEFVLWGCGLQMVITHVQS